MYIQDQTGKTPRKWNKSGLILENQSHDSHLVKVDGSGKVTKRNRQFLRKYQPFFTDVAPPVTSPPIPPVAHLTHPVQQSSPTPVLPEPRSPTPPDLAPQSPVPSSDQTVDNQQPAKTTPPSKLPRHLRERWIVNPELQTSPTTCAQYSIPPNYICTSFPNQTYVTPVINPTQMMSPGASIAHYRTDAPQLGYYRTFTELPHNPAC